MAIQENQLHTIFQNQIGRDATPYEVTKYSTASPQTLANLKGTFSKLNTDQSITDYLTHVGQDSSIDNRIALGKTYGINNVGTAEGNTALLKAMKGGQKPVSNTPIQGSIITPDASSKDSTIIPPAQDKTLSGSILKASDTTSESTDPISVGKKNVDTAYTQQQDAQKAVAEIDKTLARLKDDKMAEIARSGGVVNESSMMSEILRENAPLLARRKELAAEYTRANQNYQKAVSEQKQTEANYYKQQQLDLSKEKIDIQQQQFEEKLASSNIVKRAVYSDGTKVGEEFVNKLTGKKINVNSSGQIVGTGLPVGEFGSIVSGSSKGKITYSDFSKVPDAPTPENLNTIMPGTGGKTYGAVYQDAVTFAETGKYQKTGTSTKPSVRAYDDAVKNKAANIANALGMTLDELRLAYKGNSAAISKLIMQKATVGAFENKAKAQIDMILNGYTDPISGKQVPSLNDSVDRSQSKLVNELFVKGKILAGNTPAQLLSNALVTFSTEYAKIMSGSTGSSVGSSDSARAEAASLISAALSKGTLEETLGLLQKEMETTMEGYDQQIKETGTGIISGKAPTNRVDMSEAGARNFVEQSLTRQGLKYDALVADMRANSPAGYQPALDNDTGLPVYASATEINSGKYTPL